MLAVAFDTLKLARRLEGAGMPPKQAQDTSAALSETYVEWLSVGNVATREDVQAVKAELKADVQEVRAELLRTKSEILKWMLGQTFLILTALFGIVHNVRSVGFIYIAAPSMR